MVFLNAMLVQRLGFIDRRFVVLLRGETMRKLSPRILSASLKSMVVMAIEELQLFFKLKAGGLIINELSVFGESKV
jgi:predicted membrane chloride channel (bestrophin family)